jgi:hypothetical protein
MSVQAGRDVLITGLPRSGTTLVCHLLNMLPDTVALHEPISPSTLGLGGRSIANELSEFFETERRSILSTGYATSKAHNGRVPMNPLADETRSGQRLRNINGHRISVTNVLDPSFTLCIKQPGFVTACLPELRSVFPCYAIVRNPLATLLSWRVSGMRVAEGRSPGAERFAPDLKAALDSETDVLARQVLLLSFFFRRYADHVSDRTIRYEDIVASGGQALAMISPPAQALNLALQSRNTRGIAADNASSVIARRLLDHDGPWWRWYTPEDVRALAAR